MAKKLIDIIGKVSTRRLTSRSTLTGLDEWNMQYASSIQAQMKNINDALTEVINDISEVTPDIIFEALEPTFELSQEYVPYKTGELHDSGFMQIEKGKTFSRVVIGYAARGRPNYAVLVHERVDIPHQAPTRSKYLLAALEEDSGNIVGRIEDAMSFD